VTARRTAAAGLVALAVLAGCSGSSPKATTPTGRQGTLPPAISPPTTAVRLVTVPLANVPIPAGRTIVETQGRGTEVVPFHVKSLHLFAEENCIGPGRLSLIPFMAINCGNSPVYGTITIYPYQRNIDLKIEASPKTRWSVYIVEVT
jgi:hypothetical protein